MLVTGEGLGLTVCGGKLHALRSSFAVESSE